jgi:molybdopterin molybdotransferase
MKPPLRPVSASEARRILDGAGRVVEAEVVELADAAGRVVAGGLEAPDDLPAFPRSAMDGFAVRAADVAAATEAAPVWLALAGAVEMGVRPERAVGPGQAMAIPTGGHLPDGADAVVMIEQTEARDLAVGVRAPVAVGRNIVRPGDDVQRGALVLAAGRRLAAPEIALLAALGQLAVVVHRRPRVAVLSSGNELCDPGEVPAPPGKVRDVNQLALGALVAAAGCEVHAAGIAPDDPAGLERAVAAALVGADVVLVSGGSSVGGRDHTAEVFAGLGEVLFHGIAVRPGRPTLVARAGEALLVGLPGVPGAAMTIFEVFIRPLLRRLGGENAERRWPVAARLGAAYASVAGREDYLRVRLVERAGECWAELLPGNALSAVLATDGLVVVPAEVTEVGAGELVDVWGARG